MTLLLLANIIMVIGALTGMYCISQYNRFGFVIFFFVELSMFYMGIKTQNYGLTIAAVLYLFMNIYSWVKWGKGANDEKI